MASSGVQAGGGRAPGPSHDRGTVLAGVVLAALAVLAVAALAGQVSGIHLGLPPLFATQTPPQTTEPPRVPTPSRLVHLATIAGGVAMPVALAFAPDGSAIAAVGADGIARVWRTDGSDGPPLELDRGRAERDSRPGRDPTAALSSESNGLPPTLAGVRPVVFAPAGDVLAVGGADLVYLWDLDTGRLLRTLPTDASAESLAFAPGGRVLAVGEAEAYARATRQAVEALRRLLAP